MKTAIYSVILIILSLFIISVPKRNSLTGCFENSSGDKLIFYCGGRLGGDIYQNAASYRKVGENSVKIYEKSGKHRTVKYFVSLDENTVYFDGERLTRCSAKHG